MKINCSDIGKKYQGQWVFSDFNFLFEENSKTAIIGYNGSGKSTLVSILAGYTTPTKGSIIHFINNVEILQEDIYTHLSVGSPYLDVPDELSAEELISTFGQFKPYTHQLRIKEILELLRLDKDANKPIKYFSSGMKQRLKVGMAILSDTPLLLLDEPLSNLDKDGTSWFNEMLQNFVENKTVIIASNNIQDEIAHCDKILDISEYKKC